MEWVIRRLGVHDVEESPTMYWLVMPRYMKKDTESRIRIEDKIIKYSTGLKLLEFSTR